MGFCFLNHTADVGIRVWAESLEALFEESAYALFSLITNLEKVTPKETLFIALEGKDYEELLVSWLNELLYHHEVKNMLFSYFKVLELGSSFLRAEIKGEVFSSEKHEILTPVKAVTYHNLEIRKTGKGYEVEIILDI